MLIPAENEKDLAEIPATVREGLEIIPVDHVDEVLSRALVAPLQAIDWTERRRARGRSRRFIRRRPREKRAVRHWLRR